MEVAAGLDKVFIFCVFLSACSILIYINKDVTMNETASPDNGGDASLENLYPALVQCFAVIISGYAAGRLNLISRQEAKGLNVFVSTFSLPCLIFLSLAELDLKCVNWMFLLSILLAKSIVFFGVIIVTICISRPLHLGKPGLYAIFCTQSNDFAIGYPILLALYGKTHPEYPSYLYLMAPISLAILNPIAFVLMECGRQAQVKDNAPNSELAESCLTRQTSVNEISPTREANDLLRSRFVATETPTTSGASDEITGLNANCLQRIKKKLSVLGLVTKSIASNPIVFMTVLGIAGNLFFRYLRFVTGILEVFGTAFSGTALFLLGLRMVGTMHKLKNDALVLPAVLIAVKLLVLPLVTREVTSLINPGVNASDTLDLSTYAFLYGTFPSAPAVFVFATQYNLEIDLISSGMVACTFISAPLMFISAKMTSLDTMHPENHYRELNTFGYELGIGGLVIGAWMMLLLAVTRKISLLPHKITLFLIVSQVVICIGALLMHIVDVNNWYGQYLQFYVFEFGVYSSRVWTAQLALALFLMHSRSVCLVLKMLPYLVLLGWGIPVILVTLTGLLGVSQYRPDNLTNPYFVYGNTQAIATLVILLICFIITGASLVLLQRHRRIQARYETLVRDVNSRDIDAGIPPSTSSETRMVADIEEIASTDPNQKLSPGCGINGSDLCMSGMCSEQARQACSATLREYRNNASAAADNDNELTDPQIMRHVILLLLLITSMFVGIMLSIWTLVADDVYSGIYVEMAFLDVTLNVGQIFLTFAIFGLDASSVLLPIVSRWRKFWYGDDNIVLPDIDDLSFETTLVCYQFIEHYLVQCEKDLAKSLRSRLMVYNRCFRGSELVDWLITQKLTKDHEEAVVYASHLVLGHILRHVDNNRYFSNSDLLYTFDP